METIYQSPAFLFMNSATEHLIESATLPLAVDPATRLAAAGELHRQIEAHPDIPPAALAEATASLARADLHPRRHRWRTVLCLTTLLVSLPVLVHSAWQFAWFAGVQRVTTPFAASKPLLPDILRGLNPEQELLLMGDLTATRDAERWKPLWDSDPDNPLYLSEYAQAYFSDHKTLPPEILTAAARADTVSQTARVAYVATQGTAIVVHLQKLSNALAAGAQQCAARQDATGFRQITDDWMRLVQTTARGGETMIELLVARAFFTNPLANFRDAAQALGLDEETRRFADLHQRVQADKETRKQHGRTSPVVDLVTSHGSVFASMALPVIVSQVANPPAITEADLRPGRYAEHALFERAASLSAWAALGLCAALAALSRYRVNPQVRVLAPRMLDLLRASDWAWILLGGVMLPLLYATERHWIQHDRLLEISADAPALSRYEYAVTQVLRAELLDLIDPAVSQN